MEHFQERLCTKQNDRDTPEQFLYRVIGLKQKILLTSKHALYQHVKYNADTVQDVFLHTVYQGPGHKHDDIRQELKPLLSDCKVSDEIILRHVMKITSDENERHRRLGQALRQRQANVHNTELGVNATHGSSTKREQKPTSDIIQQLTEKVEKLSSIIESMTKPSQTRQQEHMFQGYPGRMPPRKDRLYGCPNCIERNIPNCQHCFYCGEEGHRAVGCLKKPTCQRNGSRSLPRDTQ